MTRIMPWWCAVRELCHDRAGDGLWLLRGPDAWFMGKEVLTDAG